MESSIYLGLDQTGAVDPQGRPRALPLAILYRKKKHWLLSTRMISELNSQVLSDALAAEGISSFQWSDVKLVVDCVLGLPRAVYPPGLSFRKILTQSLDVPGYGRASAQNFFSRFHSQGELPRRQVEIQLGANSVFTLVPFQRNIQTGTFRIWKDLASDPHWFHFPYLERGGMKTCQIFEGYPSFSWTQLLRVPTRKPKNLPELVKRHLPIVSMDSQTKKSVAFNPNFADAVVLALAGFDWFEQKGLRLQKNRRTQKEGWILGAAVESAATPSILIKRT